MTAPAPPASAPKRFYKDVTLEQVASGFELRLDGRRAKTRGGAPITASTRALGEAIVEEWEGQGERIDMRAMPLTHLAGAVIDRGEAERPEWIETIVSFLGTDLLCHRAPHPDELVERQRAVWDPVIAWAGDVLGVRLVVAEGIVAVDQPTESIAAAHALLAPLPVDVLFALKVATEILGSAVLALALWKRAFTPDNLFAAARLDESYQREVWGEDAEAAARERQLKADFEVVARFLSLIL